MPTIDPSRTTTLRRAFMSEMSRRWKGVRQASKARLLSGTFQGMTPEQQANDYARWLDSQIDQRVTGDNGDNYAWLLVFLLMAYRRGNTDARNELRRAGVVSSLGSVLSRDDITPDLLRALALQSPDAAALVQLLDTSIAGLRGIQDETRRQVAQVLAAGLAAGYTVEQLAALVDGRLSAIGATRSQLLATTKPVEAVNEAKLNAFLLAIGAGALLLIDPEYEYITAGDARVCPTCQAAAMKDNGSGPGVYSISQARGLIPQHPRCRCSWKLRVLRRFR